MIMITIIKIGQKYQSTPIGLELVAFNISTRVQLCSFCLAIDKKVSTAIKLHNKNNNKLQQLVQNSYWPNCLCRIAHTIAANDNNSYITRPLPVMYIQTYIGIYEFINKLGDRLPRRQCKAKFPLT